MLIKFLQKYFSTVGLPIAVFFFSMLFWIYSYLPIAKLQLHESGEGAGILGMFMLIYPTLVITFIATTVFLEVLFLLIYKGFKVAEILFFIILALVIINDIRCFIVTGGLIPLGGH